MPRKDYGEYEEHRTRTHERAWRLAAALANIRNRHCRLRLCRRHQQCCGPMLPSAHQSQAVRAQQAIGLSGKACADLPLCMADATSQHHAAVRNMCERLAEDCILDPDHPDFRGFLILIRQEMSKQSRATRANRAHLTSPARQPTSGTKQEG